MLKFWRQTARDVILKPVIETFVMLFARVVKETRVLIWKAEGVEESKHYCSVLYIVLF